jgi:hypothetical protein
MRRERQRLGEVHERTGPLDLVQSCHPEVGAFATAEPALILSKASLHFAGSIGAARWCTGPSSGKERPPRMTSGGIGGEEAVKSFVRKILRVKSLESIFCGDQNGSRHHKLFAINILGGDDLKFPISCSCHLEVAFCDPKSCVHARLRLAGRTKASVPTRTELGFARRTAEWRLSPTFSSTTGRRRIFPATSVLRGL